MRTKLGDEEFEYYLLCNKICGASHYNMKMVIKVVEPEAYEQWLKDNVYKETEAIAEVEVVEAEANITK
jgi:heme/copper-type cytochrome/quinol oxidase subunit 2